MPLLPSAAVSAVVATEAATAIAAAAVAVAVIIGNVIVGGISTDCHAPGRDCLRRCCNAGVAIEVRYVECVDVVER